MLSACATRELAHDICLEQYSKNTLEYQSCVSSEASRLNKGMLVGTVDIDLENIKFICQKQLKPQAKYLSEKAYYHRYYLCLKENGYFHNGI